MKRHQTVAPGVKLVTEAPARRRTSSRRRASRVVVRKLEAPTIEPPAITVERLGELLAGEQVAARLLRQPSDEATVIAKVLNLSLPDRHDQLHLLAFMVSDGHELSEVIAAARFCRLPLRKVVYHLMDLRLATKPELVVALGETGLRLPDIELIFDT